MYVYVDSVLNITMMYLSERKSSIGKSILETRKFQFLRPSLTDVGSIVETLDRFLDGRFMNILMTLLTVFALFGENIRIVSVNKPGDQTFYIIFFIVFLVFMMEFLLSCLVRTEYKYSFFYYLDILAALSILFDIPWVMEGIASLTTQSLFYANTLSFDETDSSFTVNILGSTGIYDSRETSSTASLHDSGSIDGIRTTRIVRLVRLTRLIRIVKLYAMVSKASETEDQQRFLSEARLASNAKDAALKRVEASRLGKSLSERTTRRVIIGVLSILFILPYLQQQEEETGTLYGLRHLFWIGLSGICTHGKSNELTSMLCIPSNLVSNDAMENLEHQDSEMVGSLSTSVNLEVWNDLMWLYSNISNFNKNPSTDPAVAKSNAPYKLVWLRIPILNNTAIVQDVKKIESSFGQWIPTPGCSLEEFREKCHIRKSDISIYRYSPRFCSTDPKITIRRSTVLNSLCSDLSVYSIFDISDLNREIAVVDILSTSFVCILIGIMSLQFQWDTQRLVVTPVEKMVQIIKELARDPLGLYANTRIREGHDSLYDTGNTASEAQILSATILGIGHLLHVGFGRLGTEIIKKNTSSGDGVLDIMMPGTVVYGIYSYVEIRPLAEITWNFGKRSISCLNLIWNIVHRCAAKWDMVATRSIDNGFLLISRLEEVKPPCNDHNKKRYIKDAHVQKRNAAAEKSVFCALKIIAECTRRLPHLLSRFADNFIARDSKQHPEEERDSKSMYSISSDQSNTTNGSGVSPQNPLNGSFGVKPEVRDFKNIWISISMHSGWSIEGPVGSETKLDACHLGPHIEEAINIQRLCDSHASPLLLSDKFYDLLSQRTKAFFRKVDHVRLNEVDLTIYNLPIFRGNLLICGTLSGTLNSCPECGSSYSITEPYCCDNLGSLRIRAELPTIQQEGLDQFPDYFFTLDEDVALLQSYHKGSEDVQLMKEKDETALRNFNKAVATFHSGDWSVAMQCIELVESYDKNEGSINLRTESMKSHIMKFGYNTHRIIELKKIKWEDYQSPSTWNGFREL